MKLIRTISLIMLAVLFAVPFSLGKPDYAKKENQKCTYCHPAGKMKELTDAGQYYKDHNHSLDGYKAPAAN